MDLIYDIETMGYPTLVFRDGKQVVRSDSKLFPNELSIISIHYKFAGHGKVKRVNFFGPNVERELEAFADCIHKADRVIGKRNRAFDDKHLTTMALKFPKFRKARARLRAISEDLEAMAKKEYMFSSYSLDNLAFDLFSERKIKTQMSWWVALLMWKIHPSAKTTKEGKAILEKMLKYGDRDVVLTERVYKKLKWAFKHRNRTCSGRDRCRECGGKNLVKNGITYTETQARQRLYCKDCEADAGVYYVIKR